MVTATERRMDLETEVRTRRFGLPALLITALVSAMLGWFGGQAAEKNNVDNIPGGAPTDSVSGPSRSDHR